MTKRTSCQGCKYFYCNQHRFGCKFDKHSFPVLKGNAWKRTFKYCPLPLVQESNEMSSNSTENETEINQGEQK
jgi:hypothetical protein